MKTIILVGAALAAGAVFWAVTSKSPQSTATAAPLAQVVVPAQLSPAAEKGRAAFEANCVRCHGANAAGKDGTAPPLVHKLYEPGHHGDGAFWRAVQLGTPAHHWTFGDMPPVPGVSDAEIGQIVAYIRELQRENGIR